MKFEKEENNNFKGKYEDYYVKYSELIEVLKTKPKDKFITEFDKNIKRICEFIKNEINIFEMNLKKELNITEQFQKECQQFPTFIRMNILGLKKLIKKYEKKYKIEIMEKYKEIFEILIKATKRADRCKIKYAIKWENCEKRHDFWISKDKFVSLLMEMSRHVDDENAKIDELRVTSIYYDDVFLNNYRYCLKENENCVTFRLSWEGDGLPSEIKIERIRGRLNKQIDGLIIGEEDVVDFLNGKDVFRKIFGFIRGDHYEMLHRNIYNEVGVFENGLTIKKKPDSELKSIRRDSIITSRHSTNKSNSTLQINNSEDTDAERYNLYKDIQTSLISKNVRPIVRTVYKRHLFKSKNLTMSLDSEIAMLKECADYELLTDPRPLTRWGRSDIPYEWPLNGVEDLRHFPHLTLRLTTTKTLPSWVVTLINESVPEVVSHFSKNFHACSLFFPTFSIRPYWMLKIHDDFSTESLSVNSATIVPEQPIVIPVRVEPKVFFANERTFLSWVQFSIFLGGVGTAMLGFGTDIAALFGLLFVFLSCLFAIYSLYLFHSRAKRIRNKDAGPYDDLYGPTIVVGIFLLVLVLAVCFKFPLKKNKKIF